MEDACGTANSVFWRSWWVRVRSLSGHLQTWIIPVSRLEVEAGERQRFRTGLTASGAPLWTAGDSFGGLVEAFAGVPRTLAPNLKVEYLCWGFSVRPGSGFSQSGGGI